MSATHTVHRTPTAGPVLYVAFELSWGSWKLAFGTDHRNGVSFDQKEGSAVAGWGR